MISSDRMAAVDENAEALGVPRKQLMESSGNAVARRVRDLVDPGASVAVVAGRGNNGGDAFVAARFLDGYDVTVHLLGRAGTIATDIARENWDALRECEYDAREVRDSRNLDLGTPDLVVDAMLGTGVTGEPREPERSAVEAVNATDAVVLAVDVPSGVDADTGEAAGVAVEADHVVTFHDRKPGLDALDADVTVADIGIPPAAERFVGPGDLGSTRRASDSTKGDAGRVFVVGGGPYTGAPALAAQAALRAGADLSFVAVPESVKTPIQGYAEDLIVQPYGSDRLTPERVDGLVETATSYDDVVVLGPGLGTADETLAAVERFLESFDGRAVVDADALSVVPEVDTDATLVCTPNRHELAEMGGPDADDLRARAEEIEAFAADLGHVVLAKGEDDVVTDGERTRICRVGTPGMTVGGTGDTLAGVAAAMLATREPFDAACVAPYVNGRAAELLDESRGDGLLASDLLDAIPTAIWGER
ncbi:NAD(P)H-hydrate dehydratase [Halomarina pelagica]|uniref:NAD(P)H-hydrate dehydratase n=1 Tax=Halomarina pelagica TaxID=2961599 RepID=UPI0020C32C68|nr:NAD(P)H-hydrate dehydratase [Halomarina sp. BND7]